jgi:hypothetical protein
MAFEKFNSVGGYSAGIPAVSVIDGNGVVVANVLTSGNVVANVIRGTTFLYANGQPFNSTPGGSDTQLQYNNNGVFGGITNVTWDGNILSLGDASAISIAGGENGYFLQTDGAGNLSWAAGGNGGGNGSPGGSNTQVQFNDAGSFGGDAGFTYNKNTNTLQVENIASGDSLDDTVNITGNLNVTGNISISTDIETTGNVIGNYLIGNGYYITDIITDIANYVSQPNQANITSLGNLEFLNVDGDIISLGNIETSGNVSAGNINLSANVYTGNASVTNKLTIGSNLTVNASAVLRVAGNVNTAGSPNINLGTLSNIHISGGVNGYVLATDGTGNLSWMVNGGGGGGGSPGGANTQVQFNNNGDFGGSPYLTFNDFTHTFQIGGNLIANSVQMGAGVYKWSTSEVYFATTTSSASGQLLYSIPVDELSGVEFEIIATEPAGPSRQSCKISSLYYNETVAFTEWGSMFINGGVGNFEVDYDAGDIITPASLQLKVTPNTSNQVTYKMLITVFAG